MSVLRKIAEAIDAGEFPFLTAAYPEMYLDSERAMERSNRKSQM